MSNLWSNLMNSVAKAGGTMTSTERSEVRGSVQKSKRSLCSLYSLVITSNDAWLFAFTSNNWYLRKIRNKLYVEGSDQSNEVIPIITTLGGESRGSQEGQQNVCLHLHSELTRNTSSPKVLERFIRENRFVIYVLELDTSVRLSTVWLAINNIKQL